MSFVTIETFPLCPLMIWSVFVVFHFPCCCLPILFWAHRPSSATSYSPPTAKPYHLTVNTTDHINNITTHTIIQQLICFTGWILHNHIWLHKITLYCNVHALSVVDTPLELIASCFCRSSLFISSWRVLHLFCSSTIVSLFNCCCN